MTDLTPLEPGTRVEWGKHDVLHVGTVIGQSEDPRDDGWYKVEEDQPDPSDNIRRWLLPLSAIHPPFEEAVATPPIPLAEVVRSCVVHDCTWTYPEPRQARFPVGDVEAFVQSANAHRAAIEAVLRAHACEHDPADWLATIGLLRQALGTVRPGHRLLAMTSYATVNGVGGAAAL